MLRHVQIQSPIVQGMPVHPGTHTSNVMFSAEFELISGMSNAREVSFFHVFPSS